MYLQIHKTRDLLLLFLYVEYSDYLSHFFRYRDLNLSLTRTVALFCKPEGDLVAKVCVHGSDAIIVCNAI